MNEVNLFAVVVAALSAFVLGGLWYSPAMFQKIWLAELDRENPEEGGHPAVVYGLSFIFAVISAVVFATWMGPDPDLREGLLKGLMAGGGIAAASFGINYMFSGYSFKLWLINGGYHTVQFLLYGLIFTYWP